MDTETHTYERLAVVVPVLDEVGEVAPWLRHIGQLLPGALVVVSDGGSRDGTVEAVESIRHRPRQRDLDAPIAALDLIVVKAPRGRGSQLRRGAMSALEHAQPTHFLFLHVDTALDARCVAGLRSAMASDDFHWGWWDLRLDGPSFSERLLEWSIRTSARLSGRPTGDQGLLVRRDVYLSTGGYEPIPLFEDVDLTTRLRRDVRGNRLEGEVISSGRRFRMGGHWQTAVNMWWLRTRWWMGARPEDLQRRLKRMAGEG